MPSIYKTCCFTGHREIVDKETVLKRIYNTISVLHKNGTVNFISGMAKGFDMLAARQVIALRSKYSDVRLICALPCRDQTVLWDESEAIAYSAILDMADKIVYVSQFNQKGAMLKRDRYMVDNSDIVIAHLTKSSGGTYYTVKYANEKGIRVINLADRAYAGDNFII